MRSRAALIALLGAVLWPAAAASAADRNPWLEQRALNIAHQGGEDESPSNTMYAFRRAVRDGADMLELDVGVTRDGEVVVTHDTTVDRTTNGRGLVSAKTLRQLRRLDAAHWFSGGADAYARGKPRSAYRFRGVATGRRRPPRGARRADFRIATLREVLRAFPDTPINVEIKGRTKAERPEEYVRNAEVLAPLLRRAARTDVIVVSFQQAAVDRFHALAPAVPVAPGIDGVARWLLARGSPGAGVVAFQLPITFTQGGQTLSITTPENVARAHREGFAWHTWLSDDGEGPATWRNLIGWCVDGVMTARPRAFERILRATDPPGSCASPS
jgi:glycerophosphoryl diester phosphodiesterase